MQKLQSSTWFFGSLMLIECQITDFLAFLRSIVINFDIEIHRSCILDVDSKTCPDFLVKLEHKYTNMHLDYSNIFFEQQPLSVTGKMKMCIYTKINACIY